MHVCVAAGGLCSAVCVCVSVGAVKASLCFSISANATQLIKLTVNARIYFHVRNRESPSPVRAAAAAAAALSRSTCLRKCLYTCSHTHTHNTDRRTDTEVHHSPLRDRFISGPVSQKPRRRACLSLHIPRYAAQPPKSSPVLQMPLSISSTKRVFCHQ